MPSVAELGDVDMGFVDGNLSSIETIETIPVHCKARHAFFSQSVFEYSIMSFAVSKRQAKN